MQARRYIPRKERGLPPVEPIVANEPVPSPPKVEEETKDVSDLYELGTMVGNTLVIGDIPEEGETVVPLTYKEPMPEVPEVPPIPEVSPPKPIYLEKDTLTGDYKPKKEYKSNGLQTWNAFKSGQWEEYKKNGNKKYVYTQIMKVVGAFWRKMSPDEKEKVANGELKIDWNTQAAKYFGEE